MATLNSSVLACKYSISGTGSSELTSRISSVPSGASSSLKLPSIRAQQAKETSGTEGRRAALGYLAATIFAVSASASSANAGVIED